MDENSLDDADWKARLTPEQYRVLRQHGTERAFTGAYHDCHEDGLYRCVGCGAELFRSGDKFDSGTGWPSFDRPVPGAVEFKTDRKLLMRRTEVRCRACGGHLGHVFQDGPRQTTGERYCINSASLSLEKTENTDSAG